MVLEAESGTVADCRGRWLPNGSVQTSHSPGEQLAKCVRNFVHNLLFIINILFNYVLLHIQWSLLVTIVLGTSLGPQELSILIRGVSS